MRKARTSDQKEARWQRDAENRAYAAQAALVERDYGKDAADRANYGWGVSADRGFVSIATKVYLETGHVVLTTEASFGNRLSHEWTDATGEPLPDWTVRTGAGLVLSRHDTSTAAIAWAEAIRESDHDRLEIHDQLGFVRAVWIA